MGYDKFDELEELKREVSESYPWKHESMVNMSYSIVSLAALCSLSLIAVIAKYVDSDPILWVVIAGFSGLAAILLTRTNVTNLRVLRLQIHLIKMHEELLHARNDIRESRAALPSAET